MAGFGNKFKGFFIEEDEPSYEDLIRRSTGESNIEEEIQSMEYEEIENLNIENSQLEGLSSVEDIYTIANMADKSKSIYKVEEIRNILPNTLSNAAKKESVLGMLQVSNITIEDVQEDANLRKNALNTIKDKFTQESISMIENSTIEINELESRVNELKEAIDGRRLLQEKQEELIDNETAKIDSILNFMI